MKAKWTATFLFGLLCCIDVATASTVEQDVENYMKWEPSRREADASSEQYIDDNENLAVAYSQSIPEENERWVEDASIDEEAETKDTGSRNTDNVWEQDPNEEHHGIIWAQTPAENQVQFADRWGQTPAQNQAQGSPDWTQAPVRSHPQEIQSFRQTPVQTDVQRYGVWSQPNLQSQAQGTQQQSSRSGIGVESYYQSNSGTSRQSGGNWATSVVQTSREQPSFSSNAQNVAGGARSSSPPGIQGSRLVDGDWNTRSGRSFEQGNLPPNVQQQAVANVARNWDPSGSQIVNPAARGWEPASISSQQTVGQNVAGRRAASAALTQQVTADWAQPVAQNSVTENHNQAPAQYGGSWGRSVGSSVQNAPRLQQQQQDVSWSGQADAGGRSPPSQVRLNDASVRPQSGVPTYAAWNNNAQQVITQSQINWGPLPSQAAGPQSVGWGSSTGQAAATGGAAGSQQDTSQAAISGLGGRKTNFVQTAGSPTGQSSGGWGPPGIQTTGSQVGGRSEVVPQVGGWGTTGGISGSPQVKNWGVGVKQGTPNQVGGWGTSFSQEPVQHRPQDEAVAQQGGNWGPGSGAGGTPQGGSWSPGLGQGNVQQVGDPSSQGGGWRLGGQVPQGGSWGSGVGQTGGGPQQTGGWGPAISQIPVKDARGWDSPGQSGIPSPPWQPQGVQPGGGPQGVDEADMGTVQGMQPDSMWTSSRDQGGPTDEASVGQPQDLPSTDGTGEQLTPTSGSVATTSPATFEASSEGGSGITDSTEDEGFGGQTTGPRGDGGIQALGPAPRPQGTFKGDPFTGGSSDGDDPSQWRLEDNIPGTPGQDYPNYTTVPETSFDCKDHAEPGYYGDVEAQCQVFHICQANGRKDSFLCPLGTVFNQQYFVCDWWYNYNCDSTPDFYNLNANLFKPVAYSGGNIKGSPIPREQVVQTAVQDDDFSGRKAAKLIDAGFTATTDVGTGTSAEVQSTSGQTGRDADAGSSSGSPEDDGFVQRGITGTTDAGVDVTAVKGGSWTRGTPQTTWGQEGARIRTTWNGNGGRTVTAPWQQGETQPQSGNLESAVTTAKQTTWNEGTSTLHTSGWESVNGQTRTWSTKGTTGQGNVWEGSTNGAQDGSWTTGTDAEGQRGTWTDGGATDQGNNWGSPQPNVQEETWTAQDSQVTGWENGDSDQRSTAGRNQQSTFWTDSQSTGPTSTGLGVETHANQRESKSSLVGPQNYDQRQKWGEQQRLNQERWSR